jgi:hypothetical protein
VLAFVDESHWLSVQAVTVDGETATRSTRYTLVRDGGAASRTARVAAAAYVSDDDVDEAGDYIDDAAVQEWLVASRAAAYASGSALDMLNRGRTRTVVVERPVFVRTYPAYSIRACFGVFCGYRYYSPWGYDLYGWRPYRPVVIHYRDRDRYRDYRDWDRDRDRDRDWDRDRHWDRNRDRDRDAKRDDGARVTRGGYSRDGVRSSGTRSGDRPSRTTQSSTRSPTSTASTGRQAKARR